LKQDLNSSQTWTVKIFPENESDPKNYLLGIRGVTKMGPRGFAPGTNGDITRLFSRKLPLFYCARASHTNVYCENQWSEI